MFKLALFLISACVIAIAGCSQGAGTADSRVIQFPADAPVAETVNGTAVPQALLESIARGHNFHLDKPDQREQALKMTTDLVLMAQAAQRDNFFADLQFHADVEAARLKGVADAAISAFEKQTPISDDVLKTAYDSEVGQAGKFEYDFSQLLFANEDDALKAAGDTLTGKPFQQVFDEWRSKAKQAKAFSRVRLDQLPQPLAQALAAMSNGETTKVPVKTEFGWHVVHLDIANPFTPPPFDQVKAGIRRSMLLKMGQQRLEKMREQAKVEYPAGTAAPVAKPSPAAEEKPAAGKEVHKLRGPALKPLSPRERGGGEGRDGVCVTAVPALIRRCAPPSPDGRRDEAAQDSATAIPLVQAPSSPPRDAPPRPLYKSRRARRTPRSGA